MVEQLVDSEQVYAIGEILKWAEDNIIDNKLTLREVVDNIMNYIDKNGLIKVNKIAGETEDYQNQDVRRLCVHTIDSGY